MKFDTTCCLLALCIFEIVNAYNLQNELMDALYDAQREIEHYKTPRKKRIKAFLKHSNSKRKYECWDHFHDSLNKLAIRQQIALNKCVYDGSQANSLQPAQACDWEVVRSIKTAVDTIVAQTKKCNKKKH